MSEKKRNPGSVPSTDLRSAHVFSNAACFRSFTRYCAKATKRCVGTVVELGRSGGNGTDSLYFLIHFWPSLTHSKSCAKRANDKLGTS